MLKFSACFTSSTDKHVTYLHRTILHWRGWEWVRTVTCQPEDVLLIQHKFSNLINNKIYISYTGQLDAFSCALCGQTFECLERKTFFSWIQNLRDRPSFKVNVTTSDECDNFLRFPNERRFALSNYRHVVSVCSSGVMGFTASGVRLRHLADFRESSTSRARWIQYWLVAVRCWAL